MKLKEYFTAKSTLLIAAAAGFAVLACLAKAGSERGFNESLYKDWNLLRWCSVLCAVVLVLCAVAALFIKMLRAMPEQIKDERMGDYTSVRIAAVAVACVFAAFWFVYDRENLFPALSWRFPERFASGTTGEKHIAALYFGRAFLRTAVNAAFVTAILHFAALPLRGKAPKAPAAAAVSAACAVCLLFPVCNLLKLLRYISVCGALTQPRAAALCVIVSQITALILVALRAFFPRVKPLAGAFAAFALSVAAADVWWIVK